MDNVVFTDLDELVRTNPHNPGNCVIQVYKPLSVTPSELIKTIKSKFTDPRLKCSFSGRLDPMAHGVTTVLFGDCCKSSPVHDGMSKIYKFMVVPGFITDSSDTLGIITSLDEKHLYQHPDCTDVDYLGTLTDTFPHFLRQTVQQLPPHSSFRVSTKDHITGKRYPLWWWAARNRLNEIELPVLPRKLHKIEAYPVVRWTSVSILVGEIIRRIESINPQHSFNQVEIAKGWELIRKKYGNLYVPIITFTATVSSGFYIRQLVSDMGKVSGIPLVTLEIERLGYLSI